MKADMLGGCPPRSSPASFRYPTCGVSAPATPPPATRPVFIRAVSVEEGACRSGFVVRHHGGQETAGFQISDFSKQPKTSPLSPPTSGERRTSDRNRKYEKGSGDPCKYEKGSGAPRRVASQKM
jgi:hypothetical protein